MKSKQNFYKLLTFHGFSYGSAYLLFLLMTHSLDSKTLGSYILLMSIANLLLQFLYLGSDTSGILILQKTGESAISQIRNYRKINFLFLLIISPIACIFLQSFELAFLLFFLALHVWDNQYYFDFNKNILKDLKAKIVLNLIPILIITYFYLNKMQIKEQWLLLFLCLGLISKAKIHWVAAKVKDKLKLESYKTLLAFCYTLFFITLLNFLLHYSDVFLLKYYLGDKSLAFYSSAYNIYAGLLAIGSSFINRYFVSENLADLKNYFKTFSFFKINLAAHLLLGGLLYLISPFIYDQLYPSEYSIALPSFQILILSLVINGPLSIITSTLSYSGHKKSVAKNLFFAVIINLLINFLTIPKYGIAAAAASTLIANFILHLSGLYIIKREKYVS